MNGEEMDFMLKVSYEKHVIECKRYHIIGQGGHGSQIFS